MSDMRAYVASLLPVSGIEPIEPPQQRGPYDPGAETTRYLLSLALNAVDDRFRDLYEVNAARLRTHLNHARRFQQLHEKKSVGRCGAHGEQAVIAQNEETVGAEIVD